MDKGLIRKVDELGRIVLPKETLKIFSIGPKDPVEVTIETRSEKLKVVLKRYYSGCVFCETFEDCVTFRDKNVCRGCLGEIKEIR